MWRGTTLKSLIVPGGILLLGIATLVHTGWLTLAPPAVTFLYYCALFGGMLLAWRFHSSRIFFALVVIFLARQAATLSGGAHTSLATRAGILLAATTVLVPLNLVLVAMRHEYGFTVSGLAPFGLLLFVQTVIVAVLARGQEAVYRLPAHAHGAMSISLPGYGIFAFAIAGGVLLVRWLVTRKPADSALLWALVSLFLSLHFLGTERTSTAYAAIAACILATSIIETSYLLAYHDELTTLPSRRAFNDALQRLREPYSIAAVDIDHFKRFNDTYGHDTGDEVLRLVAAKLARVTGGGQAYRCGGEEFAILFRGKTAPEVMVHLEQLRTTVEAAEFHQRGGDRRQTPRGPDRRGDRHGRRRKGHAIRRLAQEHSPPRLTVTVSIGVASSSSERPNPDQVLQAADQALYRAKANGRNRLEIASSSRRQGVRAKTAGIA
jgi:diguanylate cyclase (GGDEF)-like protein